VASASSVSRSWMERREEVISVYPDIWIVAPALSVNLAER
jgi:hypothetical protein